MCRLENPAQLGTSVLSENVRTLTRKSDPSLYTYSVHGVADRLMMRAYNRLATAQLSTEPYVPLPKNDILTSEVLTRAAKFLGDRVDMMSRTAPSHLHMVLDVQHALGAERDKAYELATEVAQTMLIGVAEFGSCV